MSDKDVRGTESLADLLRRSSEPPARKPPTAPEALPEDAAAAEAVEGVGWKRAAPKRLEVEVVDIEAAEFGSGGKAGARGAGCRASTRRRRRGPRSASGCAAVRRAPADHQAAHALCRA